MNKLLPATLLLTLLPLAAQVPGTVPAVPPPAEQIPPPPPTTAPEAPPAAAPPAAAAPAPVQAVLENSTLGQGEETSLTFVINNGRPEDPPQSITAPGLNIQLIGTNSRAVSIDGTPRIISETTYSVEALETGTHTIPGQTFRVNGAALKTAPLTVTVNEGEPIDEALRPQAQVSLAKTEMWEGEPVEVNVRVLMHRMINIISQPFPVITSDGIAVSRFDRNAANEMFNLDGELWTSWSLQSAIIPLKSGDLSVGPADVKLEVYMPVRGAVRGQFGDMRASRRALKIKTNSVAIKVKPLPTEGRPEGFNGAVGNFQLSVRAESSAGAQQIEIEEPIAFELMVMGVGNFDAVNAPVIEQQDGLRIHRARPSLENRGLGTEQGQKGFTQIVFPQKPGPLSIVYQLPYFDPQTGQYAWAKSQPVQFMVTGDPAKVAAEQKATDAQTKDYTGVIEALEPGEELQDILPHAVRGGHWVSLATLSPPVHPLLLHGAPAAFLLALLGIGAAKRMRAWKEANRPPAHAPRPCAAIAAELRTPGLPRLKFYGLVSEYIQAWTFWKKQPPPPPGDASWQQLLAARDRWLYAANAAAAADPVPADEQSTAAGLLLSRLSA